jgi:hypothetical protein
LDTYGRCEVWIPYQIRRPKLHRGDAACCVSTVSKKTSTPEQGGRLCSSDDCQQHPTLCVRNEQSAEGAGLRNTAPLALSFLSELRVRFLVTNFAGTLARNYPPLSSFLTVSLTTLPSTRVPLAVNLAMEFFITVPMSFIVGLPISEIVARTTAAISSSPAALGM